jgi:hypothetical protein
MTNRDSNIIFSVGPQAGKRSIDKGHGYETMSQSEVALQGLVRVVAQADDFYGAGKGFRSKLLTNPTYRALKGAAEKQVLRTEDFHHIFLEDFRVVGVEETDKGLVQLVELVMGS